MEHLQTDKPKMTWEEWLLILATKYAEVKKIDLGSAMRYINLDEALEWYEDGFSPLVCFRENI